MYLLDLQAKLARTWFEAAASGFAAMSDLIAPPRNPWFAPAAVFPMGTLWGLQQPAANPWSWMAGSNRDWWQAPMAFGGNWFNPVNFGMAGAAWPSAYRAWAGMFRTATPLSMFAPSPWQPGAPIVLPMAETAAVAIETIKLIEASYRTAGGHATAAVFRAMEPPARTREPYRSH
jgi:hypothetical protein